MAESASSLAPLHAHPSRQQDRTHMFVAATLYFDSGSCPVNVRNMSLSGALVEGSGLPELETPVTLRRGSLEAGARIVWRAGRKAGVSFSTTIHIADWMSRNPNSQQARIDDIVRDIRSGKPAAGSGGHPVSPDNALLGAELRALRAELSALEKGLTGDVIVVATHPEIQLLDVALQRVDRMLKGVTSS